ncbi:ABC-three component system protein [Leifsonia xyli]|uniref:ABC-three component system protein n=1 Tax=Leifsonia xyli TaxID=1575 RepID=UPI003D6716A4
MKAAEGDVLLTSNWREWYHFRHQQACFESGTKFEDYVSRVLEMFHDDYVNPSPAGRLGDGGCDGLAESGTIFYACYGQRPMRDAEKELAAKIASDFARGFAEWETFHTWRFVTNANVGPLAVKALTKLQTDHGPSSSRPLTVRLVKSENLWADFVSELSTETLNILFPGAPGVEHVELADLLPLLDALGSSDGSGALATGVAPVPPNKMDYNELPEGSRLEFNAGRLLAPRIDRWYAEASDPGLYDTHGQRFRSLYEDARSVTVAPAEVLERLYVSIAGPNFRMDGKLANAAFAVVAYFFDSCHIFETPPTGWAFSTEEAHVPSN